MPAIAYRTARGWVPRAADWEVNFNASVFDSGSIASFSNGAAPANTFGRDYGNSSGYLASEAAQNTYRQHYSLKSGEAGTRLGLPVSEGGNPLLLSRTGTGLLGAWTNTNTTDLLDTVEGGPRNAGGSSYVYRQVETTANGLHYASASLESITINGFGGFNCWLKQGTRRYALIYFPATNAVSSDTGIGIDLQTGSVTDAFGISSLQYRVVIGNNGWIWIHIFAQMDTTTATRQVRIGMSTAGTYATRSYTGSTGNYIFTADCYGGAVNSFIAASKANAQPGQGYSTNSATAAASSFEETVEFTRTVGNSQPSTIYCEFIPIRPTHPTNNPYSAGVPGSVPYGCYLRSGTGTPSNDSVRWGIAELVARNSSTDNSTVTQVTAINAIAIPCGQICRMALALASNDGVVVVNGTVYITKSTLTIPSNLVTIGFGYQPGSSRYGRTGILRSIKHWTNERFTNAQLQTLTTAPP
jgi:hypothetical protein